MLDGLCNAVCMLASGGPARSDGASRCLSGASVPGPLCSLGVFGESRRARGLVVSLVCSSCCPDCRIQQ